MGRDKATLVVDGRPMAVRVSDALLQAGAVEVVAIGGDPGTLGELGLRVVPDDEPGGGPLPATITALRNASTDIVLVLSCDLVRPSPQAITTLVDELRSAAPEVRAAIPVVGGAHQWTHAAWRRAAVEALQGARASGTRSLRRAAADLTIRAVHGLREDDLADADDPLDLPGAR
jgi:molybdopterin-guanine dinucleotide biosynthesis protein A